MLINTQHKQIFMTYVQLFYSLRNGFFLHKSSLHTQQILISFQRYHFSLRCRRWRSPKFQSQKISLKTFQVMKKKSHQNPVAKKNLERSSERLKHFKYSDGLGTRKFCFGFLKTPQIFGKLKKVFLVLNVLLNWMGFFESSAMSLSFSVFHF